MDKTPPITGRCYCGKTRFSVSALPSVVSYCHCSDCRRVSGAPVAAFAAFADGTVRYTPDPGAPVSHFDGVERWFCDACGSPLGARYDYLPGQIYVPLGLIDQAAELPPSLHSHAASGMPWLHIQDGLARNEKSARDTLRPGSAQK